MEWNTGLAAIRFVLSETVHIVNRHDLEKPLTGRAYIRIKTYCELAIVEDYKECSETTIDCETCLEKLTYQQDYWRKFWSSAQGVMVFKMLTGLDKREKALQELARKIDAFEQEVNEFNQLLQSCLKHTEPVFTLELPDEVLLKLLNYGSVGEVLLAFKMSDATRQMLEQELGKAGYALLGSRLISRGFLKANDPLFRRNSK